MTTKRTIGVNAFTYPELRNFAGHRFDHYTFRKVIDWYKLPSFFLFRLKHKINRKWQNSFLDLGLNRCNFFHFFNVIHQGSQPYITTFETALPRWKDTEDDFKKGLELLAKDNCVQLLALSQCAYNRQGAVTAKYRPDLSATIMKKCRVLLPPQVALINHFNEKRAMGDQIVFTMVGADFFRKGGMAVLRAFDQLITEQQAVVLNIVSTLNYGDYASKTKETDYQSAVQIIRKHSGKIFWHQQLDNASVTQLLIQTDVALLPSLAETFGYFILEAQAAGCPVITTDIRAMPEINDDNRGWLIPIKEAGSDDADIKHPELLLQKIENGLLTIIRSMASSPETIRKKGENALSGIVANHSPERHKAILQDIYDKIR